MSEGKAKIVVGASEEVLVKGPAGQRLLRSRMDTGAKSSSIDSTLAKELGIAPSKEPRWVRSSHGTTVRHVADVRFVLSGIEIESEFTIIDRSKMRYKVLIGRRGLGERFLVDPSRK